MDEPTPNSSSESCYKHDDVAMSSSDDDNDLVKVRHRTSPTRSKFDKASENSRIPSEEMAYIERTYGDDENAALEQPPLSSSSLSSFRRLSRTLSRQLERSTSSVSEALPETISGWTILLSSLAGTALSYELYLQKKLTRPPDIYGQITTTSTPVAQIYQILKSQESCFQRPIQPSLFVGTRSALSSAAAYLSRGPDRIQHFREIVTVPRDGATIALDWELPPQTTTSNMNHQEHITKGPIRSPVVLLLHGINNDSDFGYMKSLMRAIRDRGWYAVSMNFRGCGKIPLSTPRSYTGAYTGDLRAVVHIISRRLVDKEKPMLFIIGHSLGANLVAKYLGEEGKSETLPTCVAGGITLGNPMSIDSRNMSRIYSPLIAAGAKKGVLTHLRSLYPMIRSDGHFRHCIRSALSAWSLADFDRAMAGVFIRNQSEYPFDVSIGYDSAEEYWKDASSYRYTRFISVPCLQMVASDDFLVHEPFRRTLYYNITNPNIMVLETMCGGHLGWHEAPPQNSFGIGKSWADTAVVEFIAAVLEWQQQHQNQDGKEIRTQKISPDLLSRL